MGFPQPLDNQGFFYRGNNPLTTPGNTMSTTTTSASVYTTTAFEFGYQWASGLLSDTQAGALAYWGEEVYSRDPEFRTRLFLEYEVNSYDKLADEAKYHNDCAVASFMELLGLQADHPNLGVNYVNWKEGAQYQV